MTPYYKKQFEIGLAYQDFVYEILHRHGISTVGYSSELWQKKFGENKARIEIKNDDRLAETGNLYIEVAEKSDPKNPVYVESGIYRDCTEYVIGNYDVIYRLATSWLRLVDKQGKHKRIEIKMRTSCGFLLPCEQAERIAIQVMRPRCAEEMKPILAQLKDKKTIAKDQMQLLVQSMCCDPNQQSLGL